MQTSQIGNKSYIFKQVISDTITHSD